MLGYPRYNSVEATRAAPASILIHASRRRYEREANLLYARLPARSRGRSGSDQSERESCGEYRALAGLQFVVLVGRGVTEPGEQGRGSRGGGAQE